jgi:hypothetical protein
VAVHPLRPATRRRLGGPLPRQLANRPQAHPRSAHPRLSSFSHNQKNVFGITPCFHELSPIKRQITYVLLTRAPLSPDHIIPKNRLLPTLEDRIFHGPRTPLELCGRDPVRLACLKRAASVRSEPGSNSPSCSLSHRSAIIN